MVPVALIFLLQVAVLVVRDSFRHEILVQNIFDFLLSSMAVVVA